MSVETLSKPKSGSKTDELTELEELNMARRARKAAQNQAKRARAKSGKRSASTGYLAGLASDRREERADKMTVLFEQVMVSSSPSAQATLREVALTYVNVFYLQDDGNNPWPSHKLAEQAALKGLDGSLAQYAKRRLHQVFKLACARR